LVDGAQDVEPGWLAGASTVGVTAGASAPSAVVRDIVDVLSGLGEIRTRQVVVATESVQFALPRQLRR
jgi:4-hydroxy-3-methylbut-2-en-1-yl diphosphate reductase